MLCRYLAGSVDMSITYTRGGVKLEAYPNVNTQDQLAALGNYCAIIKVINDFKT